MNRAKTYLDKAKKKHKEYLDHKSIADYCFKEEQDFLRLYRIESVCNVLDFIRSEYRNGHICDLEKLLCHCQNKLYGNIDGIELELDEHFIDTRFKKVSEENGKNI